MDAFFACEGLLCLAKQHNYGFDVLDDNAHTLRIYDLPSEYMSPNNVDDAIFRYFSVYYPLLIIFTVTLPLCLPQIHYKKAFVTLFLICFTSAQTGNTYLANEDLVTYNIQALLMNTENPALVKYRREKRYKHLKLHTDHAFFFGDAADKGINEGETIYFAVRPCDYLHKLEILGTKFNLQRIETSNKCYYLFRLQRREAL